MYHAAPPHNPTALPDNPTIPDLGERTRTYAWDDPAISAAAAREQDGEAFLRAILDGSLPAVPIARTLDFRPVSVQPGTVVFEFTPAEFHYNPIGSVHGGMISTLCDSACGCAVQSLLPAGTYYTSLDLSVKFLRAVSGFRPIDMYRHRHASRWPVGPGGGAANRQRRQAACVRHQQLHDLPATVCMITRRHLPRR